jgi:hypothetical protein
MDIAQFQGPSVISVYTEVLVRMYTPEYGDVFMVLKNNKA